MQPYQQDEEVQNNQEMNAPHPSEYQEERNRQLLEQLRDTRDELRGTAQYQSKSSSKSKKLLTVGVPVIAIILLASYLLVFKKSPEQTATQTAGKQDLVLPNLQLKPSEEKTALQLIEAARKNESTKIIATWLDATKIGQSKAQFEELIASFSSAADGANVELVEKKIGNTTFGEVAANETMASSLVYKSSYYGYENKLYLKLNFYKPDPALDAWRLYLFEFKAQPEEGSPLKANLDE